ncbi:hypothetical protein RchiOBHm_Chr4g0436241 [Rosa chinensis]|uniref:Uncharacterized protein n=1 Tax=Rosa chinensis TaxID=74649 RepID=A0A2P6R222_ROSCH|nr:hypothetical protein RchiOBHm_Chr4g0436241 [Rosa chinensis]
MAVASVMRMHIGNPYPNEPSGILPHKRRQLVHQLNSTRNQFCCYMSGPDFTQTTHFNITPDHSFRKHM